MMYFVCANYFINNYAKIVKIGIVIDGLPYLDKEIIPNLIEGIKKENTILYDTDIYFDTESLQLITHEQGSGKFFLVINGFGDYRGDTTYFAVSYTITTDDEYITNAYQIKYICIGNGCDWCEIHYIGMTPIGCKACSNPNQPNGKCNFTEYYVTHKMIPLN